jgi:hypothetical protein
MRIIIRFRFGFLLTVQLSETLATYLLANRMTKKSFNLILLLVESEIEMNLKSEINDNPVAQFAF